MRIDAIQRRALLSWSFAALLLVLCGLLAFFQNRWINELGNAERSRLKQELQAELTHLSRDFNTELENSIATLLPPSSRIDEFGREQAYSEHYIRWRQSHPALFSSVALAVPQEESIELSVLSLDSGKFSPSEWPPKWAGIRDRMLSRMFARPGMEHSARSDDATLIEVPRFGGGDFGGGGPGPGHGPPQFFDRGGGRDGGPPPFGEPRINRMPGREREWLILEVNLDYIRNMLLPELLRNNLGNNGQMQYLAEVVEKDNPANVIFHTGPNADEEILRAPDVSTGLFDIDPMALRRRSSSPNSAMPARVNPPPPPSPQRGRWLMVVRHREGSLEAVVARARWQNYATSAGLLLLILATVGTMVRFSRKAEQLARLQMDFVAGVSHELRTPLTVIRTAAYNLRGSLANKPEQVERYGTLIEDESERLGGLVEQVLRFASAGAGHVIRERKAVTVESLVQDGIRASRAIARSADIDVEVRIEPGLPLVLADSMAMKQVIQNLLDNAAKYGTEGNNWIGISANSVQDQNAFVIEIRISDRGPGIPQDGQPHIFDPFFRGQRAVRDQVHGTGLGLNLVKKIVEAHGGSIRVESEPMHGATFIMRMPAAPPEQQDEFAHSLG